jgi:Domain of unknown function (DUF4342)
MTEELHREQHKVTGEKLLQTVKHLVHEGSVRRIILKDDADRTIVEIPFTVGVVGAVLLPVWVALGAIAALAADFTIEVERIPPAEPAEAAPPVEAQMVVAGKA